MSLGRSILWFGFGLFLAGTAAYGHSPAKLKVIVDTDMALDDVRAIALLASFPGVELLGGVTSDGACAPVIGAAQLTAILKELDLAGVPVGAGRALSAPAPDWRAMSESLIGSRPEGVGEWQAATEVLADLLTTHAGVTYLCLGPLSNLADLSVAAPAALENIVVIHYWGTSPETAPHSWNTARDSDAARVVFGADLPLRPMQLDDEHLLRYDRDLAEAVCALQGAAAEVLCAVHSGEQVQLLISQEHFRCWDESLVLNFLIPGLYAWDGAGEGKLALGCDLVKVRASYLGILSGDLSMMPGHRHAVNLRSFPTSDEWLQADVAYIAPETLARHGTEEWNAVLLTNELHRHLGIYSILGAKMGIRARELLAAGVDELRVLSYASDQPPLSCMTDGLQVSTGATLGRGTIAVAAGGARPAARFMKDERWLELAIQAEVITQVREDIQRCIAEHGALTPAYWRAVRALALRYWRDMARDEIFEELWGRPD